MKHKKILRIFGIALVLPLLLTLVLASPASAALVITPLPNSGIVGAQITAYGTGFSATSAVAVYFSNQYFSTPLGKIINTDVTVYKTLFIINSVDTTTTFTQTFTVPSVMDSSGNVAVTPGTYYLYVCVLNSTVPNTIQTYATFTVIGNPTITLSPTTSTAGSSVTITGTGYPASTPLVFTFDSTTTLTPTSGQSSTSTAGAFTSTVTIPSTATAGTHIVTAAAGTSTDSETFTVIATAALDPLSPATGPPGTDVMITGTNFPGSTALVFKYETTVITPKSGDIATRVNGIFITTITVPSSASAGAHTIYVTAGTTTVSATFTVIGSNATLNPLSPTSGPPGTSVTVTGSSFPASTALVFKFDATTLTPTGSTQTGSGGAFTSTIAIPSDATAGAHTITVTAGSSTATAAFTVTEATTPTPTSSLSFSSNGDTIGSLVVLVGAGFTPDGTVTITWDGEELTEGDIRPDGYFFISLEVPVSEGGDHTIAATDGTNSATATFTVESVAPSVPNPLKPGMGAIVKSPITFDWADVTETPPVTYNLQIATSPNFSADSIVLERKNLTQSQYILSEAEELRLSSEVATYYWREQAVDAASNASSWTGAGEFSVAKPFKFTGWPLYLTIGVGAVVLFLLGLWVGRRTAFFY